MLYDLSRLLTEVNDVRERHQSPPSLIESKYGRGYILFAIIIGTDMEVDMAFFKKQNFNFDTLDSLDEIKGKHFYLTGNFIQKTKQEFAEEIIGLGRNCQDLTKRPVVKPKDKDYLIIGGNAYHDPSHGNNYKKVKSWNENNPDKTIPIIHQLHCEELLEKYRELNLTSPPTN